MSKLLLTFWSTENKNEVSIVLVVMGIDEICRAYKPVTVTQPEGYIGNVVTEDIGFGTAFCPWKIKMHEGQQINITLIDFGIRMYDSDSPICQVNIRHWNDCRVRIQTKRG